MRLPNCITEPLLRRALRRIYISQPDPDHVIGVNYLSRWYITPWSGKYRQIPNEEKTRWQWFVSRLPSIYLHCFQGSDDDRALHDHPWPSCSVLLFGGYYEHVPADPEYPAGETRAIWRPERAISFRRSHAPHRIRLPENSMPPFAITLFITGVRLREWGFWCKHGWRHWRVFTDPRDRGKTGRGCE